MSDVLAEFAPIRNRSRRASRERARERASERELAMPPSASVTCGDRNGGRVSRFSFRGRCWSVLLLVLDRGVCCFDTGLEVLRLLKALKARYWSVLSLVIGRGVHCFDLWVFARARATAARLCARLPARPARRRTAAPSARRDAARPGPHGRFSQFPKSIKIGTMQKIIAWHTATAAKRPPYGQLSYFQFGKISNRGSQVPEPLLIFTSKCPFKVKSPRDWAQFSRWNS